MPPRLGKRRFTARDLWRVWNFTCGTQQWELYLSDWIQGKPGGVLQALAQGTEVWLYEWSGALVGYASLGVTTWKYPDPFGKKEAVLAIIPAIAMETAYKGAPHGPWQQHYSVEIMADLVNTAGRWHTSGRFPDPLLGLFVDVRNKRARDFYIAFGFQNYGKPIKDKASNTTRQRMLLSLAQPAQLGAVSAPSAAPAPTSGPATPSPSGGDADNGEGDAASTSERNESSEPTGDE